MIRTVRTVREMMGEEALLALRLSDSGEEQRAAFHRGVLVGLLWSARGTTLTQGYRVLHKLYRKREHERFIDGVYWSDWVRKRL